MKVEIVSIGDDLLVGDVLDTNIAHLSRSLREIRVPLTCKVTVGEDPDMVASVLQTGIRRADVVLAIDGAAQRAVLQGVLRQMSEDAQGNAANLMYETVIGDKSLQLPGCWFESDDSLVICLPRERQEMAFLLETAVLPYLRAKIQEEQAPEHVADWLLLRAVGIVESSAHLQLADLAQQPHTRITYDSFAGQTNIRVWAEGETQHEVAERLAQLKQLILLRLGDHIYGDGSARLENVILQLLGRSGIQLSLAECHTNNIIAGTLLTLPEADKQIQAMVADSCADLATALGISLPSGDLTRWCRLAVVQLLRRTQTDVSLLVYKNVSPGGIQVLVTLASNSGVSVTQRSFGGHPDNIDQWAFSLGLTHLRRWLRVHT
ncbi:MAG: hypothetical protein H6662_00960 [Ardenticatenaceae bacterium]|nr:hypothetical protein [Anaerolineales bacterium]MCB8920124.1 hypothetical protein [Ardenticatenaceae bacterium]MCB8992186.1 hypothetical protein [Ardenticatenaceae bacterium]